MGGCRKYRLDPLPQSSTGIRSHLVLFPVFRSLHLITLSLSMRGVRKVFQPISFVSGSVLCFHVCKTTQLSSYTLTRNTSHPTFLPPNHLVSRVAYYILPSPLHH